MAFFTKIHLSSTHYLTTFNSFVEYIFQTQQEVYRAGTMDCWRRFSSRHGDPTRRSVTRPICWQTYPWLILQPRPSGMIQVTKPPATADQHAGHIGTFFVPANGQPSSTLITAGTNTALISRSYTHTLILLMVRTYLPPHILYSALLWLPR